MYGYSLKILLVKFMTADDCMKSQVHTKAWKVGSRPKTYM